MHSYYNEIYNYLSNKCDNELPKSPLGHPQGWMLNLRGWDIDHVINYADFQLTDHVLEIGAMHTFWTIWLAPKVAKLIITDNFSWDERLGIKNTFISANTWAKYMELKAPNIKAEKADATQLQYETNSFDKVISISTIEHILHDKLAMQEMWRVLRPGGKLLITTEFNNINPMEYQPDQFMRIYNMYGITNLIQLCPNNRILDIIEEDDETPKRFKTIMFAMEKL